MRHVCLLIVFSITPALLPSVQAQGDEAARRAIKLLAEVDRQFMAGRRNDQDAVRAGAKVLQRLYGLERAPAEVREEACHWLKRRVMESTGSVEFRFRWRTIAIDLIGRLSETPKWVRYLERVARRAKDSSSYGLDLYVERAFAGLRGPAQVQWLMERVRARQTESATLALAGLARLERQHLLAMLGPLTPDLQELVRARNGPLAARAVALLSRIGTDEAIASIVEASKSPSHIVRVAVARALEPRISTPGAQSVLAGLLEDPHPLVRESAARALGRARTRGPVPLLIARLDKEPLRNRATIADSLRLLTGRVLAPEPEPWKTWLAAQERTGQADADARAGGADAPVEKYDAPRYHGFPVESDRVVFALDTSESMRYRMGAGAGVSTRMSHAKRELERVLARLDRRTRFGMISFGPSATRYDRQLRRATFSRKKDAVIWLHRQAARGATNTYDALRLAFTSYPKMDTMFLLSDGTPTAGATTVHERIVRDVIKWNEGRGVRINTIALLSGDPRGDEGHGAKEDALRFLQDLAESTGGDFLVLR